MSWDYLYTFLQTCVLELPFYAFFLNGTWSRRVAAVLALNAFTHPIVFFVLMSAKMPLVYSLGLGELFAFGFEAWACFYFLGLSARRAVIAATSANLVSWQFAPMMTYVVYF